MVSSPPQAVRLVTRLVRSVLLIVAAWVAAMVSLWLLADMVRTETATAASRDVFETVLQSEQKRLVQVARDYA
jgi:sensor domain CHASE-containing protein